MKNVIHTTKILALAIAAIGFLTISCHKDELSTLTGANTVMQQDQVQNPNPTVQSSSANSTSCGDPIVTDLYAGQNIPMGTVTMSNTGTDFVVTIATTGNWVINQTQLYAGDAAAMPTNNAGNPMIGQFPYNDPHSGITTYTYTIPLANLGACFAVAFHADVALLDANGNVVQTETAWGDGERFVNAGSWATYYNYCVQDCCEAQDSVYQIYGGQTIPVGDLIVNNDDDNVYVTYTTSGCWELSETHLYVGDPANIPTNNANTPIPGQFTYQASHSGGTTTYTYTVPLANLPACYAVAAHSSVVCTSASGGTQQETAWSDGTDFPGTNRWGWYSEYCTQSCN
ncbi:MAG: hypothetical protein GY810_25470 [Aureispira sp.]|nr:hypothetical protein [Aureispira sp.]